MQEMSVDMIRKRFKEAWDIVTSKHGEKQRFFKKYDIVYTNFHRSITQPGNNIRIEHLAFFTHEFGVSAEWILTGRGSMFSRGVDSKKIANKIQPNLHQPNNQIYNTTK